LAEWSPIGGRKDKGILIATRQASSGEVIGEHSNKRFREGHNTSAGVGFRCTDDWSSTSVFDDDLLDSHRPGKQIEIPNA